MKRLLAAIVASSLSYTGLDLLTSMILSRLLGPSAVGELSLVTNFATLFAVIGTFGFVQANVIYFSNGNRGQQSLYAFFKLAACSFFFLVALLYVFSQLPSSEHSVANLLRFQEKIAAIVYISLHVLVIYLSGFLLAFRQNRAYAITNVVYSAIVFLTIATNYMTNTTSIDLLYTLAVFGIAKLLLLVVIVGLLIKNSTMFEASNGDNKAFDYASSRGYYYYNVVQQIVTFAPIFVLSYYLHDNESLGYFSRALSITLLLTLVPLSIGPHLFSRWASSKSEQHAQLPKVILVFFGLIAITAPIIYIYAFDIMVLFYGSSFEPAGQFLQLMLVSAALRVLYDPLMNAISAMNKHYVNLRIMLLSLIVFIVSSILMQSDEQALAVVYSLIASNAAVFMLCCCYYIYAVRSSKNDK